MAECSLTAPRVCFHLHNEANQEWIIADFADFELCVIARREDAEAQLVCNRFQVVHPSHPLCPTVVMSRDQEHALKCQVQVQSMYSPKYKVGSFLLLFRTRTLS